MSRCKGIPTYTQHTVAWPTQPLYRDASVTDEVGVSFDAKGGGTIAELHFAFHKFSKGGGVRIECFDDGLPALLDDRVQRVLLSIRRSRTDITPARLIAFLEAEGVQPSLFHLRGLRPNVSWAEQKEIDKAIAKLRKHEEWS